METHTVTLDGRTSKCENGLVEGKWPCPFHEWFEHPDSDQAPEPEVQKASIHICTMPDWA